ncbi:SgcJ/EcaC family oxidoreductase [Micromonospora sp. 4G55]|uniref:SgcJ/EcaC family oxidoreductase n=1 Tax=Micromonospora sp. 4G55 TaxID=2806102 RepID=UPI001A4574B3|nr:SgcJ/EcaC family oxidoreductase [Micromonospora sp. 4G55]MBM0257128.1 SgcJ/EcaC family oxidoreductase [Micromonospora sp. 4G55]
MDEVLGRWKAAFDDHDVEAMADLFHPDALFLGFGPEVLVGRQMVRAYYGAVPADRSADVTVLHTYSIDQGAAGGFAHVVFRDPTGWEAPVYLSLALQLSAGSWRIRQYHVCRIGPQR